MKSTRLPFQELLPKSQKLLSVLAILPNENILSSFLELHFSFDEGEKNIDLLSPILGEESGEDYIKSMLMSIGNPSEEYVDSHIEKVRLEKGKKALAEPIKTLLSQNWIEKTEENDITYYFLPQENRTQLLKTQQEQIWKHTYSFLQSWEYKMQSATLLDKNYEVYSDYTKYFLQLSETENPFLEVENGIIQDLIAKICKKIALYGFDNEYLDDAFFFIEKAAFLQKKLTEKFPQNTEYESELGTMYEKWGDMLYKLGHTKTAFSFYNLKVGIAEKLVKLFPNDDDLLFDLASLYGGIGKLEFEREHYHQALEWYELQADFIKEREELMEDVDYLHLLQEATNYLAEIKDFRDYHIMALESRIENCDYLEKLAYEFSEVLTAEQEINYADNLAKNFQKIGDLYYTKKQIPLAIDYFQYQIDTYKHLIDDAEHQEDKDYFQNAMSIGKVKLARCYIKTEQNERALEILKEAEHLFLDIQSPSSDEEDRQIIEKSLKVVRDLMKKITMLFILCNFIQLFS
ncbi:tetratricopeptide repeat protein [Bernardetia sp.]|uniref:tetratricopeptide repeat protein n=1 Tax=Bernardetia sp. TaxID=1937974 RepID=UPI0025C2431B|nr:hypothetical protein [Bernardetia sp.]